MLVSITRTATNGFVLQGPVEHLVEPAAPIFGGFDTPADQVSVSIDGAPLAAGSFTVNPALRTVTLLLNPPTATVEAFVLDATGVVHLAKDILAGDVVTATVNGVVVVGLVDVVANTVTFAGQPVGAQVAVSIVRPLAAVVAVHRTAVEEFVLGESGVVHLAAGILPGAVVSATVNGVAVTTFTVDEAADTVTFTGLPVGAVVIVTVVNTTTEAFTVTVAADRTLLLSTPIFAGFTTPADTVAVSVGGTPLAATDFTVDPAAGTVGLHVSPATTTTAVVTLTKTFVERLALDGPGVVHLATDLRVGDVVTATVNGIPVSAAALVVDTALDTVAFTGLPAGARAIVTVVRVVSESFTLPGTTDDDTVDAAASSMQLVIFGGIGADHLTAGTGGDIVFGDRGTVLWFDPATVLPAIPSSGPGAALLAQLTALAARTAGHGGVGEHNDGLSHVIGLLVSLDPTMGGGDTISAPAGSAIVIAGAGADHVTTGSGANLVFGDNAFASYAPYAAGTKSAIVLAASLAPGLGAGDTITLGSGGGIVVGGAGGDTITAPERPDPHRRRQRRGRRRAGQPGSVRGAAAHARAGAFDGCGLRR